MLARSQRILAGIELFALALWVGGLFFLLAFADPAIRMLYPDDKDAAWRIMHAFHTRFGALEPIFAIVVLASNFLKLIVFRGMNEMQRFAVLIAAIMVTITLFTTYQLRPVLDEKKAGIPTLSHPAVNGADDVLKFEKMVGKYEAFLMFNLMLGLFMVYAYRTFEERKLQAITRILKAP